MRIFVLIFLMFSGYFGKAQSDIDTLGTTMEFENFLGLVREFHPIAKQANLNIAKAKAGVLKARGAFDPKIEANYEGKEFLGSDYFDILQTSLKIPTWYGVEFKAGFDDADGVFLNPQQFIPDDGRIFSAGISVSLGEGLFINKRMATLRTAKLIRELSLAERTLEINQVLTDASLSYFNWLKTYRELKLYERFLKNAETRFQGIKRQVEQGDKAAIDSIEAGITIKNRRLNLEQSKLAYRKSQLAMEGFLWIKNNVPVVLEKDVIPELNLSESVDEILGISANLGDAFILEEHPKIRALQQKVNILEVDKKLKADKLKPRLDANYNFLTSDAERINSFNFRDFKAGFSFSLDLFLRKERGDLKIARFKVQDAELAYKNEFIQLQNKIAANYESLLSFEEQWFLLDGIVKDYAQLLTAEERKFNLGESSVFLVNTRERTLIDTELKQIGLEAKRFKTKVALFNSLAIDPQLSF